MALLRRCEAERDAFRRQVRVLRDGIARMEHMAQEGQNSRFVGPAGQSIFWQQIVDEARRLRQPVAPTEDALEGAGSDGANP